MSERGPKALWRWIKENFPLRVHWRTTCEGSRPKTHWWGLDGEATLLSLLLLAVAGSLWLYYRASAKELHGAASRLHAAMVVAQHDGKTDAEIRDIVIDKLTEEEEMRSKRELALHLAVACVVAFFVIITVERSASRRSEGEQEAFLLHMRDDRKRFKKQIAGGVWKALAGRLLPRRISKQLDVILKENFVRWSSVYSLTFRPKYEQMPEGYLILRRRLAYKVENITGQAGIYPVRLSITVDDAATRGKDGDTEFDLPRIVRVFIKRKGKDREDVTGEGKLTPADNHCVTFEYGLSVEAGEIVRVVSEAEEAVRETDENNYLTHVPTVGLRMRYKSEVHGLEVKRVKMHHPDWREFAVDEDDESGEYRYRGGLLPGQGFMIAWTYQPQMTIEEQGP